MVTSVGRWEVVGARGSRMWSKAVIDRRYGVRSVLEVVKATGA